jgi:cytochrome bd ubiquinol oxidase subunit II
VLAAVIAITLVSFRVQPHLNQSFAARPWAYAFPLFALAGLFGMKVMNASGRAMEAFLSSCAFILGMLTSVAAGLYPYVLPSSTDPALSLTIHNTAAGHYGLQVGLIWFIPGMLLTAAYFIYTYRSFAGKV